MADEIEIVKTERAAAPDGAEWMDQPPAGVQPDDFVCGLRRGGVKCWIDNDGLVLDHAVFMMTRDLVALITEAVRLGDRQWVSLLAACKDAAVEAANETAAAVTRSLNAVVADVRKAIDADQGANTYDALRAFADSAKVSSRALAEFANMLGCGEGEIGDHIRRIISAVDGCSAGTVATKVEELRNALLVVERSESKRHAEIASAARLLSDAGFSGATLEDRVKAVLRERASIVLLVTEDGEIYRRNRSTGEWRRATFTNGKGYRIIRYTSNKKSAYAYGHRVVWTTLRGPIPPGRVVNHLDGNKANNAPGNLEVVTHQQNVRHAIDVLGVNRGERCGQAKLTEQSVREIRAMREAGATYAAIGERFGVSGNQASRVVRRLDWAHVA